MKDVNYSAIYEDMKAGLEDSQIAAHHELPDGCVRRLRSLWKKTLKDRNILVMGENGRKAALRRGYNDHVLALASRKSPEVIRTHKEIIGWMTTHLERIQADIELGEDCKERLRELRLMAQVVTGMITAERMTYAMPVGITDAEAKAIAQAFQTRPANEILPPLPKDAGRRLNGNGSGNGAVH